jgi:hypothetical protein
VTAEGVRDIARTPSCAFVTPSPAG